MTKRSSIVITIGLLIAAVPAARAVSVTSLTEASGDASRAVQCQHYWERAGELVASGKPVGIDVGEPPSAEFEKTGTYICRVSLGRSDAVNGRYLFIGEVGDASYLEVQSVNGHSVHSLPVNHGLSPDPREPPVYTRYLPFVVPVRDIYVEDGVYEFKIRYKDLSLQVGIRSGVPTVETFTGVIRRAITCSPAFTFHVVQFLVFILLSISFAVWPKLSPLKRIIFSSASAASACVILQLSAVPRSFLSQMWAMRLNDFSQLLTFPILGAALLVFFYPNRTRWRARIATTHLVLAILAVTVLFSLGVRDTTYIRLFGAFLLLLGAAPCFLLGYALRARWLTFTGGPGTPRFLPYAFMGLGILYAFDVYNLVVLESKFYYFNHFLFFSTIILAVWRMQSEVSPNEVNLRNRLATQNKKAYSAITGSPDGEFETLETFVRDLGNLLSSSRISTHEIVDGRLRFVGHYGDYVNTQGLHEIRVPSLIDAAIESRQIQYGRMPSRVRTGTDTDVVVVPLENNDKVIGVLCATEFNRGLLPRFYRDRMGTIKQECEPVLALLLSERHNRAKERLIQMMRNRTHPLQLRSEEYFLKNFDISPTLQSHAFIYGDLVGSVGLNERHKDSGAVEQTLDEHLALIWNRFKELGVIVSRTKGDMISFVVPSQLFDSSERNAVQKCFQILCYISDADQELQALGKKHEISMPLRYRFAMSRIERPLLKSGDDQSLRSFSLLVDTAIDETARAVNGVAMDGECLILEAAKRCLDPGLPLLELDPQWLKGKSISVRIWSLNGNVLQNAG